MVYNKASAKDRKKIFEAFQEDRDWKAVAKMCDVKPGTAYKWLINGSATVKPKGGSASKGLLTSVYISTRSRNMAQM